MLQINDIFKNTAKIIVTEKGPQNKLWHKKEAVFNNECRDFTENSKKKCGLRKFYVEIMNVEYFIIALFEEVVFESIL